MADSHIGFEARILIALLVCGWLGGALSAGAQEVEGFQPAPQDQEELIVEERAPRAAGSLAFESLCEGAKPFARKVTLSWSAPREAGQVRVDFTAFRDGFARSRFLMTRELASTTTSIAFVDLEPGINYYWRVLLRAGSGWRSSEVGRFEAPTCPVDLVRE